MYCVGPLVLAIAASTIGLAFATVAGMTAVALFLPAAIFIGGTLAAFSVLGSIFSLVSIYKICCNKLERIVLPHILHAGRSVPLLARFAALWCTEEAAFEVVFCSWVLCHFFLPVAAYFWFKRSGEAKVLAAEREAAVRRDEWQAKEYRRQQEELELLQTQEEELESFDRRLRSRWLPHSSAH